jgi:hypothetical protein
MNLDDVDEVLVEHAQRWNESQPPPPPLDLAARQARAARRPIRTRLAIAACVITVAGVAAAAVLIHQHSRGRSTPASPALITTVFPTGLTLRHPRAWTYVPEPDTNSSGPSAPVGYLTNERRIAACATHRVALHDCGMADRMTAGGVWVDVTQVDVPAPMTGRPTQTIAGYPAQVTTGSGAAPPCPSPGGAVSITAKIDLSDRLTKPTVPWGYVITACLAGPRLAAAEHQVHRMLDTATTQLTCQMCPGPPPPRLTIHVGIGDVSVPRGNRVAPTPVRAGTPVTVSVTVANPDQDSMTGFYVYLTPDGPDAVVGTPVPAGEVLILFHPGTPVRSGQTLTTTWTPRPLFGQRTLDVAIRTNVGGGVTEGQIFGHIRMSK